MAGKACVCVECRYCRLEIEKAKAKRVCEKTGKKLKLGEVIHRCACKNFKPPAPAPHWGA